MKRAVAVLFTVAALAGRGGAQATEPLPVITVFEFSGSGIPQAELVVFADYLVSHVVQLGEYRVIDRSQRKDLLEEVGFSQSDCPDETCQIEIGRMLSASRVVVGSVGQFGTRYILNARLVDVESAKLINSVSRDYARMDEILQDSGNVVLQLLRPGPATGSSGPIAPVGGAATAAPQAASQPEKPRAAVGTFRVAEKQIAADGNSGDWKGVAVAYADSQGERPGPMDLKSATTAMDSKYGYILVELYGAEWTSDVVVTLDIDFTAGTSGWYGSSTADLNLSFHRDRLNVQRTPDVAYKISGHRFAFKNGTFEVAIPLSSPRRIGKVEHFNLNWVGIWHEKEPGHWAACILVDEGTIKSYNSSQ